MSTFIIHHHGRLCRNGSEEKVLRRAVGLTAIHPLSSHGCFPGSCSCNLIYAGASTWHR